MLAQGKPLSYFEMIDPYYPFEDAVLFWLCALFGCVAAGAVVVAVAMRVKMKWSHLRIAVRTGHVSAMLVVCLICLMQGMFFCRLSAIELETGGTPDALRMVVLLGEFGERLFWLAGAVATLVVFMIIRWTSGHHYGDGQPSESI